MESLTVAVLNHPGDCVMAHGDSHVGNAFWQYDSGRVTFIDISTGVQSISSLGQPIGCAARDTLNFVHKLVNIFSYAAYHTIRLILLLFTDDDVVGVAWC